MPHLRRTHVPAAASAVARIVAALDAFCAAERVPDDVAWRLRVALDEIVANIVAHGSSGGAVPTIDVSFRRRDRGVEIVVADDGPAFDPLAVPAPDVDAPLEERRPGGLGIALVKSLMDDLKYERTAHNVLTMWKRIGPNAAPGKTEADGHPSKHS